MIESRFEEIFDTIKFTLDNNPTIEKDGKIIINEAIQDYINEKIQQFEDGKQKDIEDLTNVVEEIADKLVEDNTSIKNRLNDIEKNYSNNDVENAVANTNRIIKVLEKELKEDQEKSKQKINQLKTEPIKT